MEMGREKSIKINVHIKKWAIKEIWTPTDRSRKYPPMHPISRFKRVNPESKAMLFQRKKGLIKLAILHEKYSLWCNPGILLMAALIMP
jgi:hypothetical protein